MAKDSIFEGPAGTAIIKPQKTSAPPNTKQAKGYNGPLNAVVYTATNRNPEKSDITGTNNVQYVKGLKKTNSEGNY